MAPLAGRCPEARASGRGLLCSLPRSRDVLGTPPSPSPGPFSSLCPNLALGPQGMGQALPLFFVPFSSPGGGILEAGGPLLGACLLCPHAGSFLAVLTASPGSCPFLSSHPLLPGAPGHTAMMCWGGRRLLPRSGPREVPHLYQQLRAPRPGRI